MSLIYVALFFLLLNAAFVLSSHESRTKESFEDLNPRQPRVEFESDGGRLETWGGRGSGAFEDANVAACRLVLKQRGTLLPSYQDVPSLHVVTRGGGRVGIVTPFSDRRVQENTFKVVKGDAVAVPQGHVVWWYNDEEQDMEVVGVADVTQSSRPAGLRAFHLAGAKRDQGREEREQQSYGAVIHGFSKDVLSRAWGMDEERLSELLQSQTEGGIIRLDRDITFPEQDNVNVFFQNFIYRLGKVHADLRVENGGEVRELDSLKLPVLRHLGLALECAQLEQGAMVAPNWVFNHQVLYVMSGRGRVEIVNNNGEQALDADLEAGSVIVIPAFFPSAKIASRDQDFHYISFVTSHTPVISFMSGRNSVYRGIPSQVLSRMLNVREDQARQIQQAHNKESIIFPSADEGSRREALYM